MKTTLRQYTVLKNVKYVYCYIDLYLMFVGVKTTFRNNFGQMWSLHFIAIL